MFARDIKYCSEKMTNNSHIDAICLLVLVLIIVSYSLHMPGILLLFLLFVAFTNAICTQLHGGHEIVGTLMWDTNMAAVTTRESTLLFHILKYSEE